MRHTELQLPHPQGLLFDYEEEKKAHDETNERYRSSEESLNSQIKELEIKLSAGSECNKSLTSTGEQLQLSIDQLNDIKKVCQFCSSACYL